MLIIIDLLIKLICGINLISFIICFYYMDILEFGLSLVIFYFFNNDFLYIFIMILIYLLEKITKRYTNYNLIFRLSLVTFYYVILFDIDRSYLINLLLVILIDNYKYNIIGDSFGIKKLSKKSI